MERAPSSGTRRRWLRMGGLPRTVLAGALIFASGLSLGAAPVLRGAVARMMGRLRPVSERTALLPSDYDWATYGGNLSNSFSDPRSPITANSVATLKPAWHVSADGKVTGNAVAVGSRVFFASAGGTVYAVARSTGRVLWTRPLDYSPINGGALYDGGRLFFATTGGYVFCLQPNTGRIVWRSAALFHHEPDALRASPRAYAGVLYESVGGTWDDQHERGAVVALDEETGQILWRTDLVHYTGGGAAVFSPPAIVPRLDELVVATGNPIPFPNNFYQPGRGPVPAGGAPYSDSLVALSLDDGHILWAHQTHASDAGDFDFIAAPNVLQLAGGRLAVGDGEKDGSYYLIDATTGNPIWSADLTEPHTTSPIVATAAVADGSVFVGTMDVATDVSSWPANYQPPATGRLIALAGATGEVLWSDTLPSAIAAAPVVGRGVVIAVEADGTLVAVRAADGHMLWQSNAGGQIWNAEAGLSLADATLLVPLAHPGGVTAFALPQGQD